MKYQVILTLFSLSPLASAAVKSSTDSSLPEVTTSPFRALATEPR